MMILIIERRQGWWDTVYDMNAHLNGMDCTGRGRGGEGKVDIDH